MNVAVLLSCWLASLLVVFIVGWRCGGDAEYRRASRASVENAEDTIDRIMPGFSTAYDKQAFPWWRRWLNRARRAWRRRKDPTWTRMPAPSAERKPKPPGTGAVPPPVGACGIRGCPNKRPHSHVMDLSRRLWGK